MPKSERNTIHTIEIVLLQASVFLIPSNLAYHFYINSAYINGRLSDYLLPKLYLSDLPILALLVIYIYRITKKRDIFSKINKRFWILFLYLLGISLSSDYGISSSWYVLKLLEYYLFAKYLIHTYSVAEFRRVILMPLFALIILQSGVGLYQYISQKSLFGYYFMGEPNLSNPNITKVTTTNGLEVIPYGTTAHPNILAGVMAVAILVIITSRQIDYKKMTKKAEHIMLMGLGIGTIILTRSLSALSGLLIGIFLSIKNNCNSSQKLRLPIQVWICISLLSSLLIYPIFYQHRIVVDNTSFQERYELNSIAMNMFLASPLSGVGPNLFTAHLPQYPISSQQSYLLQPAHHGLILILAETGIIGLVLILLNLSNWRRMSKAVKSPLSAFLPLIGLYVILLLDHYPLTLQSGQLLLVLSLTIPLLKPSS